MTNQRDVEPDSRKRVIAYWLATALFCLMMTAGGIFDIIKHEQVVATLNNLGYPLYVAPLLGVWKLLGVIALLAPGFARIKEWAYAGFAIDLISAAISHIAVDGVTGDIVGPLVFLAIGVASYLLRPATRRLAGPAL